MAAISKGMVRVGVLLSVIWVLAVGAMVGIDGNRRNNACAAAPVTGLCRHFFWAWELPPVVADKPAQPKEGEKAEDRLRRALVHTLAKVIEETQEREFRLRPDRIALAIFAPLLLGWGLGFGVAWTMQGFKEEKK